MREIEEKWLKVWESGRIFEANPDARKKFFITFPYPYVNGPPHLGHAYSFCKADVMARYKRMRGYNVLFPFAFHATGEPIMGVAERIRRGEAKQKEILLDAGVSEGDVEKFKDPLFIVSYWREKWLNCIKRYGGSIDWRRSFITTDITPTYSKFIEWQYRRLKALGYVVQGTHPVIYCPNCRSPTGDHDRLEGEGESPEEYVLIKFRMGDFILPAGTFRPETVFGVTNLWINPDETYVRVQVDDEKWIVSKQAAEKLKEQLRDVQLLGDVRGSELVGEVVNEPINNRGIMILPASFVSGESASGIVMCVPAHAPYDWVALEDLKRNERTLENFQIDPLYVGALTPIKIIETEGLGANPAGEVCERLGVASQADEELLEKATSEVYRKEFHSGKLNETCGTYAGLTISQSKEKLTQDFVAGGIADSMWDTVNKVVCRCNTKCIVKILENQWFLKFSDEEWKEKVKKAMEKMVFIPEAVRSQFLNTIDWLRDKACARRSGLGTKLPWDKEWIVETLSDSVIYMAYYTIAKVLNESKIPAEALTDEVFDYIFLGKGDIYKVESSQLPTAKISEMRREFQYWYPVDLRVSAKDLVQNHLTFFVFHHTALFEERYWPKGIAVNGYVNVRGQKMSKSKGNFVTLPQALEQFGADAARFILMYAGEGLDDPDWTPSDIGKHSQKLDQFLATIDEIKSLGWEETRIDKWLVSRMQMNVRRATEACEELRTRSALQAGFFDMLNDVKWYLKRGGRNRNTMQKVFSTISKLISPIVPFTAEEAWGRLGGSESIFKSSWPSFDPMLLNDEVELGEELMVKTISDIKQILELVGKTPGKIHLYVAPNWKRKLMLMVSQNKGKDHRELIILAMADPEIKKKGNDAVALIGRLVKELNRIPENLLAAEAEHFALRHSKEFLEEQFDCKFEIQLAEKPEHDPANKAKNAMPMKPAIFIE